MFETLLFETLLGDSEIFAANIHFLQHHRLDRLVELCTVADRELRKELRNAMFITQEQLDALKQTDQDLSDAITAALTRSQQAQFAAQGAAQDLAAQNDKITALQAQLAEAGTSVDLSGILGDLKAAKDKVNGIDVTLASTTGTTPAVGIGDTVNVATDPADPISATADHTVTEVSPDGTTATEPVAPTEEPVDQEQSAEEQGGDTAQTEVAVTTI